MRKIIFIFIGSLFAVNTLTGQNYHKFPDSNFVWNYTVSNYDGGPCGTTEYVKLTIEGDTIIGTNSYHKLYYSSVAYRYNMAPWTCGPNIYTSPTLCDLIRQDTIQKKVYRFDLGSHSEKLLIDFDLKIGQKHPITECIFDSLRYYVSSIDSVFLGDNKFHRRYNFAFLDSSYDLCHNSGIYTFREPFSLIEGVGYTRGFKYGADWSSNLYLLVDPDCGGLWGEASILTCFGQLNQAWGGCQNATGISVRDSVYFASPGTLCDLTVSLESISAYDLLIFPNPTNEFINIITPKSANNKSARIVDVYGKTILQFLLNDSHSQIQVLSLSPGMYFLVIDGTSYVTKFVKE